MSWKTPIGQMTEQYIRPITSLRIIRNTTTPKFSANKAGTNCILGIQPTKKLNLPPKPRNNSVIAAKKTAPATILIFLSISFHFIYKFIYLWQRFLCCHCIKAEFLQWAPVCLRTVDDMWNLFAECSLNAGTIQQIKSQRTYYVCI